MDLAVCTLFEGHYHFGLAALVNSLYKNNFRGQVYVGFRGALPPWAQNAQPNAALSWVDAKTFTLQDDLAIHFLPLQTKWHLANYKPTFMLDLIDGPAANAEGIFYFDPDITIVNTWDNFEDWISYGVALVHEIVSNDMPETHPLRQGWAELINRFELGPVRRINSYINSGFCGVSKEHKGFLLLWKHIMKIAVEHYDLPVGQLGSRNRPYLFRLTDQDAFNISAMCSKEPISEIGPEAMGFIHGAIKMAHATGSPKPWKKKYLFSALNGKAPSFADKAFWNNIDGIINCLPKSTIRLKKMGLQFSTFMCRFYKKY